MEPQQTVQVQEECDYIMIKFAHHISKYPTPEKPKSHLIDLNLESPRLHPKSLVFSDPENVTSLWIHKYGTLTDCTGPERVRIYIMILFN